MEKERSLVGVTGDGEDRVPVPAGNRSGSHDRPIGGHLAQKANLSATRSLDLPANEAGGLLRQSEGCFARARAGERRCRFDFESVEARETMVRRTRGPHPGHV